MAPKAELLKFLEAVGDCDAKLLWTSHGVLVCCLSDKMNTRGSKMLDGDVSFSKDGVRPLRFQVGEIIVHGQVCACTSMRVGLRMRSFVLA